MLPLKRFWPSLNYWRTGFFYALTIGTPLLIFSWHLRSQTIGLSPAEAAARSSAKLSNIATDPLFAPYKLAENLIYHLTGGHIFGLRATSVLFSLGILVMFFYVLKAWFGKSIALLTILLLALTPIYLISSRTATPIILYSLPLAFLFAYQKLKKSESSRVDWVIFIFISAASLYVPGLVWLYLISFIFWHREIIKPFTQISRSYSALTIAAILLLMAPLFIAMVLHPSLVKQWLLLPNHWPSPLSAAKDLAWTILGLFIRLKSTQDLSVGRLAVLNSVQIGLFIFGLYVMWTRLRKQFYWLVSCLGAIVILSSINNDYSVLLMALPIIAFICGMGLRYLFVEWRGVFPKNPLAKSFAITLMFGIITIHAFYGIRYSLLAWPTTTHVRQIYMLK